jgi:hypothetical protein
MGDSEQPVKKNVDLTTGERGLRIVAGAQLLTFELLASAFTVPRT